MSLGRRPNKFVDAFVFFILGVIATIASSRVNCLIGYCIFATSGSGVDTRGFNIDQTTASLIQNAPIVVFSIAGIFLITGCIDYNRAQDKSRNIIRDNKYLLDTEAEKYLDLGNKHFKIENYEEAILCYQKAIKVDPNYTEAYIRRGLAKRKLEDYEGALEDYGKAILINPDNSVVYVNRSVVLSILDDLEGAMKDLNKAIYLDPSNAFTYTNRASIYLDLEDYDLAIEDYTKAIQILPGRSGFYVARGDIYLDLDDKVAAIEDYKKAAETYNGRRSENYYIELVELIKQLELETEGEI